MFEFFASDVGKVALGGVIAITGQLLVFLLGWAKEARISDKKRQSDAQHLGIRLVLVMEKLVGDCCLAANDPTYTDEHGLTRNAVPNPEFSLPLEGDYRALPTDLMYEIMSLPNRLDAIKEAMASAYEFADPPDYETYYFHRDESLAKLGLQAVRLIKSLCDKYKIPPPDRPEYYDPEQDLLNHLKRIERIKESREQLRKKLLSTLETQQN